MADSDTGTDVSTDMSEVNTDISDVESTDSKGSMVIKHRTNSSLGNHMDLVNRMVSRWGSMGDGELDGITDDLETDSDFDEIQNQNPNAPKKSPKQSDTSQKPKTLPKPGHRRKKSATDEMKLLKMEREALESAFDQYIDPDQNGDVDCEEWALGIQKLNVQLNEMQQRKIYNLMDKDESGFIEKDDFVAFATAKFDNQELVLLQKPILEAVRVQNLHNRTHSNLMNPVMSQDWNDYDMELLQAEMVDAMTGMASTMKVELKEEAEFEKEVKERIEENPEILKSENAFKWTKYEVSHWITEMGMERYSRYFAQESVDGPMLLEDITQQMLETNLGVRTIHAKKIMREITTLKKAVRGVTDLLLDESDFICTHTFDDIEKKIAQAAIVQDLERCRRQKEQLKKFYENELMKLNKVIIDLKENGTGKKHKKKKHRKKDTKQLEDSIVLPQPPKEHMSNKSVLDLGVLAPLSDFNEDIDITDESVAQEVKEEVDEDNEEVVDEDNEDTQEEETEMKEESKEMEVESEVKQDISDDEESEESESESESDDEYSGKKLMGMTQSHLMQVRQTKKGASPKQINRFIKDIRKKKQEIGDRFCVVEMDTIEEWTKLEVAYWIISIGFEQYAFAFYALPIDGDMLIRDMNRESIIEDLGVMKIHSNRILRQIDKLRRIISEGFDEEIMDGAHIEPDLERPTMATIESLQEKVEQLNTERDHIMQELENKNDDDEESGYFSKKIQELETERNELKENSEKFTLEMEDIKVSHNEQIENLSNTLNEANGANDELRKEIKQMKKEVRKAKRAGFDGDDIEDEESDDDDDDEPEEIDMEEVEITHSKDEISTQIRKEMEDNTQFGLEEKVLEWSPAEVCQWLKNIQFEKYIAVFYSAQIFGDVLIQDVGTRMLSKFKVTSMHIPKLLRQIGELRKGCVDKGVRIVLGQEVDKEMFPQKYAKDKSEKKANVNVPKGKYAEMESALAESVQKLQEWEGKNSESQEQIHEWEQQFDEEKQVRIAVELELEQLKQEYESVVRSGSKQQVETLENMISSIEECKIRTVRDLNEQLNSLRIGCRLMQKEIAYLKSKQGFHPMDSLISTLGYSAPPKY